MNKLNAILLGIALFLPLLVGCNGPLETDIKVTSVKLQDWKDPKDGYVYLVALPTWTNGGKEAVRQVAFVANIKDAEAYASPEPKEPQFYGAIVEPGTTVKPERIPEDGVILGVKQELEEKYGKLDADRIEMVGFGSAEEYKPKSQTDA